MRIVLPIVEKPTTARIIGTVMLVAGNYILFVNPTRPKGKDGK